jgi:outer membrane protein assembly factor BamB
MFGLSLGGVQQWARPLAGSDDMLMQQQRQPATGSDGSLYLTGMGGASGWSLYRVDPGSGNVLWNYSPWPSNGMSPPSVGPDGSVYFSRSLAYLESVTPAGQSRWTFFDGSIIDHPAVSPDGSRLLSLRASRYSLATQIVPARPRSDCGPSGQQQPSRAPGNGEE